MGLRINTNVQSINARRHLGSATHGLNRNYERLSTGKRISRASDDAAGLAISARFNAQVRSIDQAVRNANDGISLVQTAEGALGEIESTLVRMRELSVQSSNGTLSGADQDNLQAEFAALQASIDQIANGTNFNGIDLANSTTEISLQVGANTVDGVDTLTFSTVDVQASALTVGSLDIGAGGDPSLAISNIDTALDAVTSARGDLGAVQNRLETTISAAQVRSESLSAAKSRILDVDVASETAALTKNSILQQSALSILAQANQAPSAALSLLG